MIQKMEEWGLKENGKDEGSREREGGNHTKRKREGEVEMEENSKRWCPSGSETTHMCVVRIDPRIRRLSMCGGMSAITRCTQTMYAKGRVSTQFGVDLGSFGCAWGACVLGLCCGVGGVSRMGINKICQRIRGKD